MSRKLYKSLKAQKDRTEQVKLTIYGSLGIPLNGRKVVQVDNRQGYVYVRLRDNQNEVIQAFNNKVAASYDLPVIVVREGGRYVVQQFNSQRYLNNAQNSAPFLPGHGTQHSFPRGGGADITWVYGQQIMPALVYPEASTGTNVMIDKYPLYNPNGRWIYAGGTGTQNILQYLPTTGSSSLMALVYLDAITGNPGILVNSGTYFPAVITGSVYPYLPSPSSTQIPLAGVLLNTGTQTIGWENLYDVRQWVHTTPSGTSSGGGGSGADTIGFAGLSNGVPLGTGTMLNVQGAGASFTRSGTMFNLNIPGGGGTDQIGIFGQNKGVPLATGTVLNVNGTRITMSVSGTVFNLTNSPDPQDNLGIYGISGTTGLGTGTSISFGTELWSSITGTTLYLNTAATFMSGWVSVLPTWTFASSSTINVPSDGTLTYQKGMKIRFRQGGGYKYFIVKSVTTTLITVFINTDYTVANSAITEISYSYQENPFGFPNSFTYTPTFNDLSVGNGTLYGKMEVHGTRIIQKAGIIFGSTTSITAVTGILNLVPLATPLALGTTQEYFGATTIRDTGTALYEGTVYLIGGNLYPQVSATAGAYAAPSNITALVPMTWTTNDEISMICEYTF